MLKIFSVGVMSRRCFPTIMSRMKFASQPARQAMSIESCYRLLDAVEDCSDDELKNKYLKLAKSSHPDKDQESSKFLEIKNAYETIVNHRNSLKEAAKQGLAKNEEKFIFEHKPPQHRQHLEYSGSGTMSERFKQTQQRRVDDAFNKLSDHKFKKVIGETTQEDEVVKLQEMARKTVTTQSIDKLVDGLISESMKREDFKDLPGSSKPREIKYGSDNPLVDVDSYHINKVLIKEGSAPDWITLMKDIREQRATSMFTLLVAHARSTTSKDPKQYDLVKYGNNFKDDMRAVNKSIDRFNLIAPSMQLQMCHFDFNSDLERISKMTIDELNEEIQKIKTKNPELDLYYDPNSMHDDDNNKREKSSDDGKKITFSDFLRDIFSSFKDPKK